MEDCLFCKIVRGEFPSEKVYENDKVLAFRDISPQAPVHVVIIPKQHFTDISECAQKYNGLTANLMEAAAAIAKAEGVGETGFRLATNQGADGAQSVKHLHFHLLGGRQLSGKLG